ncbi:MAG: TrkH family potassium uptake protein [Thermodesulfatator sp.]|nr:MAG: TrkH family potassium uptake protein [Thermodesulfatator sp.]
MKLLINIRERLYILNYLGALLTITGAFMFIPLVPFFLYDQPSGTGLSILSFVIPGTISILTGLILQFSFPFKAPSLRGAMIITALGWIIAGLLGGVPYMLGLHKSFIDAFFESVSGFTTTGITVFEGLDQMPRSILFWRSFTQWLGGLGILSFFMAVSFRGGSTAAALFSAEGHKIDISRPVPGIFHTLIILWSIYTAFTLVSCFVFWLTGMSGFDAINHCFTCISTGGFSTHDASLAWWQQNGTKNAWLIEFSAVIFMLAGGTNFLIHYRILTGDVKSLFRDFEMRWYWSIAGGAVFLVIMDHIVAFNLREPMGITHLFNIFRTALFQVSSLITSTGYLTTDINSPFFPDMSKQILMILMVIGGCVGSTAGGIKILRASILFRTISVEIRKISRPRRAVMPIVISGRIVSQTELQRITALLWSWLLIIAAGAFVTSFLSDLDPWQAFSGMASAMGNMGPFYFTVHKMAQLHWLIKLTYIFGMLAGRLEILPLAVLFAIYRRRI